MKTNILNWIINRIDKTKWNIVILCIAQAVLGCSSVLYALLLRNGIDYAADKNKSGFITSLILVIGLIAAQILIRSLIRRLEELSRTSIENRFKSGLLAVLLKKEYASVTKIHSGEWMNRLTSDTKIIADNIVDVFPGIIGMAIKMIGAFVMLTIIEPRFLAILLPGGIVFVLLTYVFRKKLKKLHKSIQEQDGSLLIFLQEHLSSLAILKSFSAEKQTIDQAEEKMNAHKNARMKRNRFSNICNMGFSSVMNGMYLLGFGYCGLGIVAGTVSYGTLTAVLQLISQIQSPFANITGYLPKFYAMIASAERLREAENFANDCEDAVKSDTEIQHFYDTEFSSISAHDVSFCYDTEERETVLDSMNFVIHKGETVAFVGHSGCGKSTILKLLMCLYHCTNGELLLNETIPLTSAWHKLFAYVPQGNQLMHGTIREIITFSEQDANEEKIRKALKIACADTFVAKLDDDLDTMLGERGTGLSEGQMQRIAIARAIYADAPILLLDEATSSLDEQTEKILLENIHNMTNKTIIIVTHRPKALEICDRIIRFDDKKS